MRSIFSALGILALIGLPTLRADEVLTVVDRVVQQHLAYVYGSDDLKSGGLDCSGFVQTVFHDAAGIALPNEADKQLDYCRDHGQVWYSNSGWTTATLQPGDLIFYAGPDALPRTSRVSHVMIYCGHGIMAGAQSKGRRLDGTGTGVGYYSFFPRQPNGILGESGDRFLGNRRVFAYGRLNIAPSLTTPPLIASLASMLAKHPPVRTVIATAHPAKPFGINARFD